MIIAAGLLILSSCYTRLGDLNSVSNRNIDKSTDYVLLQRDVKETAKIRKDDALENAVDKATALHAGEYMMNVKIYISPTKVKVIGDVWGVAPKDSIN